MFSLLNVTRVCCHLVNDFTRSVHNHENRNHWSETIQIFLSVGVYSETMINTKLSFSLPKTQSQNLPKAKLLLASPKMAPSSVNQKETLELSTGLNETLVQSEEIVNATLAEPVGREAEQDSTKALLAKMKPYIKGVHVVSAAKDGMPPILSGQGVENNVAIPEGLSALPGERWVMTPRIERAHERFLAKTTNAELRTQNFETKQYLGPFLSERYGDKTGQVIVELGPATNTDLAEAIGGEGNLYFGLDVSRPLMERSRELLNEPGFRLEDTYQVEGDTYRMPFEDDVADVLCVSCHPPFVSAEPADKIRALAEVKRVLKPGGEFALFPWNSEERHPEVKRFLSEEFELMETGSTMGNRDLLILKAK